MAMRSQCCCWCLRDMGLIEENKARSGAGSMHGETIHDGSVSEAMHGLQKRRLCCKFGVCAIKWPQATAIWSVAADRVDAGIHIAFANCMQAACLLPW